MKQETSSTVQKDRSVSQDRYISPDDRAAFRKVVITHYRKHGRDLPWRQTDDPYKILVSELMLQQTQVGRVIEKFTPFIERFADFAALAAAPLIEVLSHWKGLGYNRRALYLKETARVVVERHGGRLPQSTDELVKLPGIGKNTAGAIVAFAFNGPAVFIETNIRSVFIHHFFPDRVEIPDIEILPLVEATLDRKNPRRWYGALMDYGSTLKERIENPGRRSTRYAKQSPFIGSDRQIRGAILGLLVSPSRRRAFDGMTVPEITAFLPMEPERVEDNLSRLIEEGFIIRQRGRCRIA
ncbi:MAG: A/G-specific adenine glycosylase [Deltaproteobacteria bacterium]|nr:A/G-specific adenine glycosylase [Candidatus Zymogenaceae bacterium]